MKILKYLFWSVIICVFSVGIVQYFIENGKNLIENTFKAKETTVHSLDNFENNQEKTEENTGYIPTFLEFPKAPLDFLDEILPSATPDPNREFGEIKEITIKSGEKVDNFTVNDSSDSGMNLEKQLKKDLPFEIEDFSKPTVLIYHTHTTEAYYSGVMDYYYLDHNFRNSDPENSIVAVGDAITQTLESYGVNVIHDTTIHDSPYYNGSYDRSYDTIEKILEENPSIKITIDVHRDSMTTDENVKYKTTAEIDGKTSSQVMILTGSDPNGELNFPNWEENLIFALKLQQKAGEMYPNLMRPLMFCQRRYNMYATNASLIFEVGTEVNTLGEAVYAGELMANVIFETIKK